jgi:hypothetical protein
MAISMKIRPKVQPSPSFSEPTGTPNNSSITPWSKKQALMRG